MIIFALMACDRNIFKEGHFLCTLMWQPGPMPYADLEAVCQRLNEAAKGNVRFDWHPIGGRPQLLYLGEHADAVSVLQEQAAYVMEAINAYGRRYYDTCEFPMGRYFPMRELPKLAEPRMIDLGQAMDRGLF